LPPKLPRLVTDVAGRFNRSRPNVVSCPSHLPETTTRETDNLANVAAVVNAASRCLLINFSAPGRRLRVVRHQRGVCLSLAATGQLSSYCGESQRPGSTRPRLPERLLLYGDNIAPSLCAIPNSLQRVVMIDPPPSAPRELPTESRTPLLSSKPAHRSDDIDPVVLASPTSRQRWRLNPQPISRHRRRCSAKTESASVSGNCRCHRLP